MFNLFDQAQRRVFEPAQRALWTTAAVLVVLGAWGAPCVAQEPQRGVGQGILVLAASSLTEVLPRIADAWAGEGSLPPRFSFDATSRLARQAVAGARADVFVSADKEWMRWLESEGAVASGVARAIATNRLVAIVPRDAGPLSGPDQLDRFDRIGLAGENVPAGRYARAALEGTGVWGQIRDRVVSGGSVRGVLEWVARGEVPVGIVYRTDAIAEPAVDIAYAFSSASHPPVQYWAAPLLTSRRPTDAQEFVDFLGGADGGELLGSSGFFQATSGAVSLEPTESTPPALPSIGSAIRLSLLVAFMATVLGALPAISLGWLLARRDFRGKALVSTAVLAPLVIPPVVTGFLLLTLLGSQSLVGRWLAAAGLPIPFTIIGATVAALVVGLPLYVLSTRGAFEAVDPLYEELSWTLGVPPRKTFLRISLPLALPGIAAGALLAFARALGEFGATVVLAGNLEGSTRTIALAVYTLLESPSGRETTWLLVGASVSLSLLALLGFETLSRRQKLRLDDDYAR